MIAVITVTIVDNCCPSAGPCKVLVWQPSVFIKGATSTAPRDLDGRKLAESVQRGTRQYHDARNNQDDDKPR